MAEAKPLGGRAAQRRLPANFAPQTWDEIAPYVDELTRRPLPDAAALRGWLVDWEVCEDSLDQIGVWREIARDQRLDDAAAQQEHLHWSEQIRPRLNAALTALRRRLVEHPLANDLGPEWAQVLRRFSNQLGIHAPANLKLQAACDGLVAEYYRLRGAQRDEYDGSDPNGDRRRRGYEAMAARRLADAEPLQRIADGLLERRQRMVGHAGTADFRALRWRQLDRFDYTPRQALDLAETVAAQVRPLLRRIDALRAVRLGRRQRPWDTAAPLDGGAALRPFADSDGLLAGVRRLVRMHCPLFMSSFDYMLRHRLLDLEPRPGKAAFVGYNQFLRARRAGFIFANARPTQRDLEGVLHEFGHAFHVLAYRAVRPTWNRTAPLEFAEAVANGFQLILGGHLEGVFYDAEEARRARARQLEGVLDNVLYTARGELFLHWLHAAQPPDAAARAKYWTELCERWGRDIDWQGQEDYLGICWAYEMPHLFFSPFYWIEYLFGQLGALQLWRRYRRRPEEALAMLHEAMRLGGARPLDQLFAVAGMELMPSAAAVALLLEDVEEELQGLRGGAF